jgi:hypothetical protein
MHIYRHLILCCFLFPTLIQAGELRGRVIDHQDRQPLPGVNIIIPQTSYGTTTDANGFYNLTNLPSGTYTVEYHFVGYKTISINNLSISDTTTTQKDIALKSDILTLQEIVVTPGRFSMLKQDPVAQQTLSREEIKSIPQFGDDIYRAVTRLPGVTGSDFSSRFTIRGGEHDQVLVTLDGLELIEPFHLKDVEGGGISIVDTDIIGGIDMITGGFPADYGNKQSAVMEMKSATPRSGQHYAIGLGLANARLFAEGGNENLGWLISARRGYLDLVLKLMDDDNENFRPVYYDLFGKLVHNINDKHSVALNFLWANDNLNFRDDERDNYEFFSTYNNGSAWLVWQATFTPHLHARTLPYIGYNTTKREGNTYFTSFNTPSLYQRVDDTRETTRYGIKSDWTYQAHTRHLIRFGSDIKRQNAEYDYYKQDGIFFLRDTTQVNLSPQTTQFSAYLSDKWRIAGPLTADLSIRYDHHSHTKENDISPRVALALPIGNNTILRAAWGQFYQAQGVDELPIQYNDLNFRRSERATHYILGIEQQLPANLQLRLEGYYKDLNHMRDRYEDIQNEIEMLPELHSDIAHLYPQTGYIRGLEFYLKRDTGGKFNWWTSYTLSQARETHSSTLGGFTQTMGRTYPQKRDQRHQLSIDLIFRPSPNWNISTAWIYRSGWPHTAKHIIAVPNNQNTTTNVLNYVDLYDDRYPAYHRLDVKLNRRFTFNAWRLQTSLGVVNLYSRRNIRGYYYGLTNNRTTRVQEAETWFPLLPSFTISAEF